MGRQLLTLLAPFYPHSCCTLAFSPLPSPSRSADALGLSHRSLPPCVQAGRAYSQLATFSLRSTPLPSPTPPPPRCLSRVRCADTGRSRSATRICASSTPTRAACLCSKSVGKCEEFASSSLPRAARLYYIVWKYSFRLTLAMELRSLDFIE